MKHKLPLLLASLAMAFSVGTGIATLKEDNSKVEETNAYYSPSTHYEVSDTASELSSYYSTISDSDTGTSLLSKLQSLNSSKQKRTMGYDTMGTDTGGAFIYTDYDLNSTAKDSNGQTYGTKVASFYTKTAATGWNREHMWPNSHGGNNVEADILHTRPTISSENSSRGNSFYVEGKNNSSSGWDPYTAGYSEYCRGECARVILYCVVAYPSFTLSDADSHSTSNSNKDNMMGNMNTLIKWHFNYLPNVYEMNRNNGAEYLQGNRNPFVDHPEYVARIWSNFNSNVTSLCNQNSSKYSNWSAGSYCDYGSNTPSHTLDNISISKSTAGILTGSTTTISATASNGGTITWTTSNSSIVSISSNSSQSGANITLTAGSVGTATITARATINGTQYSQTCEVTVSATKQVVSISVSGETTSYSVDDTFIKPTVTATYNDNTQATVTSDANCAGYDMSTAGEYTVTVSYTYSNNTVQTTYTITVTGSGGSQEEGDGYTITTSSFSTDGYDKGFVSELSSIFGLSNAGRVSGKIQFKSGSGYIYNKTSLNLSKIIINGLSGTITVYGGESSNPSTTTISASNGQYDLTGYHFFKIKSSGSSVATCTSINIVLASEKTLSSISVSTAPTKTTYTAGEYFDPTGLVITRNYSDSTSDTYTYANHTSDFGFTPSTSTALTTGNTSVTITYGGKSCSQVITVNAAKTLSSIAVSTAPTKTTYYEGQTFDPTGLVIQRNYSDSTSDTYTYSGHNSEFTFTPSTSTALTTGNTSVTITYGGESTSQAITVNAVVLTSIDITTEPTKTTYYVGDTFSSTGLVVTASYNNEESHTVTPTSISSPNMSTAGQKTVTVSYTEGGVTKTDTFNITVSAVELSSITVSGYTTSFAIGASFEFGGTVTANYNNGSTSNVTASASFSGYDMNSLGSQTVTVTYGGKSTTYQITIHSGEGNPYIDITTGGGYEVGNKVTSLPSSDTKVYLANNAKSSWVGGTSSSLTSVSSSSNASIFVLSSDGTIRYYDQSTEQAGLYVYCTGGSNTTVSLSSNSAQWNNGMSNSTYPGLLQLSGGRFLMFNSSSVKAYASTNLSTNVSNIIYAYLATESQGSTTSVEITSISATSSITTYHPGETFDTSKVTVEGTYTLNNQEYQRTLPTEDCLFGPSNYMFTYDDARNGTKSISVSWEGVATSIEITVTRVAYVNPSSSTDVLTVGDTEASGTSYVDFSGVSKPSGAVYAGNNAKSNDAIQLRDNGGAGIWTTSSGGKIKSITVTWQSSTSNGRTLNIYLSNSPYSGIPSETKQGSIVKGTSTSFTVTGDYSYVCLKSNSGAMYLTDISIEYGSEQSAKNVSNYIMYEDTVNQCSTKLTTAIGYLSGCSETELSTFQTSTDYVIATARERLEAWARNQGKSINYSTGNVTLTTQSLPVLEKLSVNNSTIIVVVLSSLGLAAIGGYFFIKKRKEI